MVTDFSNNTCIARIGRLVYLLLYFLTFITICFVIVPFSPLMPHGSLDPSWAMGVNQAVAQNFVFGKDIIFTLGPYASVLTQVFHPQTDNIMMLGSLWFAISYWGVVFFLTRGKHWYLLVLFIILFAGLAVRRDTILFTYPLFFCLVCLCQDSDLSRSHKAFFLDQVKLAFFASTLGLLVLVKGTLLPLCVCSLSLVLINLLFQHRFWDTAIVAISAMASTVIFWRLSGQVVRDIPIFFMSLIPIISGYTDAMSSSGAGREVVIYLVSAFIMLYALWYENLLLSKYRFVIFFTFLFVAFKEGFVRHDGHALVAGTALLFAAFSYAVVCRNRRIMTIVVIFALLAWATIDRGHEHTTVVSVANRLKSTYITAVDGICRRICDDNPFIEDYNKSLAESNNTLKLPRMSGKVDVYSYNQSELISSGCSWFPRPIFQSYSAYEPELAQQNAHHLQGKHAPDWIFFRITPIDGRVPSSEDGLSWPTLLSRYVPESFLDQDCLVLKLLSRDKFSTEFADIKREECKLETSVAVPYSRTPIFVTITIRPTIFGRLLNLLYKPSPLMMSMDLADGSSRNFRLVPGMAKAGFIVSPLIETAEEFSFLYCQRNLLSLKNVKSFKVLDLGRGWDWNHNYFVTFKSVKSLQKLDTSVLLNHVKFDNALAQDVVCNVRYSNESKGNVDVINGVIPSPSMKISPTVLRLTGWIAESVDAGQLYDHVAIVLTDESGRRFCYRARKIMRNDVAIYWGRPSLSLCGFEACIDARSFQGIYRLEVAGIKNNSIHICNNIKIGLQFDNNTYD